MVKDVLVDRIEPSRTLRNTPRRRRLSVRSRKKRFTMLSQEALVGVNWTWKRRCRLSHRVTFVFMGRVVVAYEMHIKVLRHFLYR